MTWQAILKALAGTVAATALLAAASCTTVPDVAEREPSEYVVRNVKNTYVGFSFDLAPAARDDIAAIDILYEGRKVAAGTMLDEQDGVVRVIINGMFSWRAGDAVELQIVTRRREVHEFRIGDPNLLYREAYRGTKYPL